MTGAVPETMIGHIRLHRIAVFAHHGVLAEEKTLGQRFYLSLDIEVDLAGASTSDDIADTVDYGELAQLAERIATTERFRLIEALAGRIAGAALDRFAAIRAITVTVEKPGAPIPLTLDGVTVDLTRRRKELQ